jgi:hypothetical protein
MSLQTTLLTSHKGVDLHAASALLVMKDRLEGGQRLVNLFRCEMHTFWDESMPGGMEKMLTVGHYFNPNKHHYGHFTTTDGATPWFKWNDRHGESVAAFWPGRNAGTDLDGLSAEGSDLYDQLLGGKPAGGHTAVDVIAYSLDQTGPVLSGVVWRLVIDGDAASAQEVGLALALAQSRKMGLLVNPHMENWLVK